MTSTLTRRALLGACALALTATGALGADKFPGGKPIKLVVPYPPGGSADTVGRIFAEKLAEKLSATVIVDNKSGASGTIGAESVLRADPDGHTLLLTVTSQLSNAPPNVKPKYDAAKDFAPIVGISLAPMALAVPTSLGVDSIQDLEKLAKSKPLAYGSYGTGSSGHVMLGTYSRSLGANMVHVPYRGEAPLVADLLGDRVQVALLTVGIAKQMQDTGKMKLLGTVGPKRSEFLPKLPTFEEQKQAGFDWTFGVALYASSKTPAPLIAELRSVGQEIVADADVQKKLRAISAEPWGAPGDELQKRLIADTEQWDKSLKQMGDMK